MENISEGWGWNLDLRSKDKGGNLKREMTVKYNDGKELNFFKFVNEEVVESQKSDKGICEIKYSNGDYYKGSVNDVYLKNGKGVYRWDQGYLYQGEFFGNEPYGKGEYFDCMGVRREGYFIRGFRLKKNHGLEEMKSILVSEFSTGNTCTINSEDIKLLMDIDVVIGSGIFSKCLIQYRKIYLEIEESIQEFRSDLRNIIDGELDYQYNWVQNSNRVIRSLVLDSKLGETASIQNREITKLMRDRPERSPRRTLIDLRQGEEKEKKYDWIGEIKLRSLKTFEKDNIVEAVKDQDHKAVDKVYKRYLEGGLIGRFFKLKDPKERNLLMISAFYGRRQIFIDLLTALIRAVRSKAINRKSFTKVISQRDFEGNNVIDLMCIKGFEDSDEQAMSEIENDPQVWDEDLFNDVRLESNPWSSHRASKTNSVFNSAIWMVKNPDRPLFQSTFITYDRLKDYLEKLKTSKKIHTKNILFVSKRATCLHVLLKVVNMVKKIDLLPRSFYHERKNNPLHFTLFHGDLHSTMELLKQKLEMMFWRNSELEMPPQVIRWSGNNYYQSKAVFSSVLRECTRVFNFQVIKEVHLRGGEILKIQKARQHNIIKDAEDIKQTERERVNAMKLAINKEVYFDQEKVFLFSNNYILLSPELCKQYIELIKEKSRFRQNKDKHKIQKEFTFVLNSELEALQKNFLDYFERDRGGAALEIKKRTEERIQAILTWYVYVYGDVEINPDVYNILGLDPFKIILDGKNIFHFMCENNSYCLLNDFVNDFLERCERGYRGVNYGRKNARGSPRYIANFKRFRRKLMIQTKENQNTPAHLCAMNKSFECLELILRFNVDLERINLRGRKVTELLLKYFKEDFSKEQEFNPANISRQLFNLVQGDILSTCKQHSMKFKYMRDEEDKNKTLFKILNRSIFSLDKKTSKIRDHVLNSTERILNEKYEKMDDLVILESFVSHVNELMKHDDSESRVKAFRKMCIEELARLRKEASLVKSKEELASLKIEFREIKTLWDINYHNAITLLQYFIQHFNDNKSIQMSTQNYIRLIFDFRTLEKIKNFKYKKLEKLIKKNFLNIIEKHDMSDPLTTEIKDKLSLDRHFCIEVWSKEGQMIQDHPILEQLNRMKKKYSVDSEGLIIDIIRGYPEKTSKPVTWNRPRTWCNAFKSDLTQIKWYLVLKFSDQLLHRVATDDQMKTYNMKRQFHTLFYKDAINPEELEPLRHSQKIQILMKLIKQEFDIDAYLENGIIKSYFPVHDYNKRKVIEQLWSKNKFSLHLQDIFMATKNTTLQVLSLIGFYFGIQQGFYFAFLSLYNNSLFILASVGIFGTCLSFVNVNRDFVVFARAISSGVWSTLFINSWKRREKELAYSFDTLEEDIIKQVRSRYKGDYVIDPGTLKIQKKPKILYVRQVIFTITLFTIGVSLTFAVFGLVQHLNSTDMVKSRTYGTIFTGILNGTLNFVISLLYNLGVNQLVIWENHIYDENRRKSLILKTQTFKLFSQVFTLMFQALFIVDSSPSAITFGDFGIQIFSNLITSSLLNYSISIGLPLFRYMFIRYHYTKYFLTCKWCCCCRTKRRGKLDEFRERAIIKMLADNMTRHAFLRYCTKEGKMTKEMEEDVKDYIDEKINEERESSYKSGSRVKEGRIGDSREIPFMNNNTRVIRSENSNDHELMMFKGDEYNIQSISMSAKKASHIFDSIEKVQKHKDYKGDASALGINRRKNISLKLKEEFVKFVLGREQIIETSYMVDLESIEVDLYSSLLSQFTFICFFSQFLVATGLVSYIINLITIFLTVKLYTKVCKRPISRRVRSIEVWSQLFNTISYLGIVINTIFAIKFTRGFEVFTGTKFERAYEVEIIYRIQFGLLIFKFLFSLVVPTLPSWIKQRMSREKLALTRSSKNLTNALNKFKNKFENYKDMFQDQDSADLKYFFKMKIALMT